MLISHLVDEDSQPHPGCAATRARMLSGAAALSMPAPPQPALTPPGGALSTGSFVCKHLKKLGVDWEQQNRREESERFSLIDQRGKLRGPCQHEVFFRTAIRFPVFVQSYRASAQKPPSPVVQALYPSTLKSCMIRSSSPSEIFQS